MSKRCMINVIDLKNLLTYDPITGIFIWNYRRGLGSRCSEQIAGNVNVRGRRRIKINDCLFQASHLAWLYMTGMWPCRDIDHQNRVSNDNKWNNLRLATVSQNNANRGLHKNNKSGFAGAMKSGNKYCARIRKDGKFIYLGIYNTAEEAHNVYKQAKVKLFGDFGKLI